MTTRATARSLPPGPGDGPGRGLLLVATLDARLLQQLAVLLLRHALAALLDDGTHERTFVSTCFRTIAVRGRARTRPALPTGHSTRTPEDGRPGRDRHGRRATAPSDGVVAVAVRRSRRRTGRDSRARPSRAPGRTGRPARRAACPRGRAG